MARAQEPSQVVAIRLNPSPFIMANASVLPVGVVVPTLNAKSHLARHVKRLRELVPRVEEMVVVDSHSEDGTAEYLREHLSLPKVRHLSHPPGLYASWNFGLSQLHAKYAYIATVGDAVSLATLEQMVALAEQREADLLLTPPTLVSESGQVSDQKWPIHDFIKRHRLTEAAEISGWKAFAWTALNVPAGLMGSSASNLYRTEVLQRHSFPVGFGHHGDTAWLLENALRLRIVLAPQIASEFLVHESANRARASGDTPRRVLLSRLARHTMERAKAEGRAWPNETDWCQALDRFWDAMERWSAAREKYRLIRQGSPFWWLAPRAWQTRMDRNRLMKDLRQITHEALLRLTDYEG